MLRALMATASAQAPGFAAAAALSALLTLSAPSSASDAPPQSAASPSPTEQTPNRETPDYAGRAPPPTTVGDVALWVPRVILSPLYLVSEFVIRRPLGALITVAERHDWASTIVDFFTFGPNHQAGLVPTAFYDFGFQPSVGVYFFWNDAFAHGHDLRAHASYFGSSWVAVGASERFHIGATSMASINAQWVRRPDYLYFGEGAKAPSSHLSRYLANIIDVAPKFDLQVGRSIRYEARAGLRAVSFEDRGYAGDPSVNTQVRRGVFPAPPDYGQGYTEVYERLNLALDSRHETDSSQSGVRAVAHFEHATDLHADPAASWIRYGASAGAFADLYHERVIGLSAFGELADPLHGGPIPFTEEALLGGVAPMTGLYPGRLHGRSTAAASLLYTWPIWVWLRGRMNVAVGNAFDVGFRDFRPGLLRLSSGIGIESTGSQDHRLEILVGFGTDTFDNGSRIESFRLAVGGTSGF